MEKSNKPMKPKTSARPAKTKKLNMPPKAQNLCGNCGQPLPNRIVDFCAPCAERLDELLNFPF